MKTQTTSPPIRGSLISDLKQLPKPFYLLILGTFINRFGHFVIPFLVIYIDQLGFPPSVTGYSLAAFGLGGLCASLIGGYLADRIGRKPTLLISCFGAAAAMLILSCARTVPTLILGTRAIKDHLFWFLNRNQLGRRLSPSRHTDRLHKPISWSQPLCRFLSI